MNIFFIRRVERDRNTKTWRPTPGWFFRYSDMSDSESDIQVTKYVLKEGLESSTVRILFLQRMFPLKNLEGASVTEEFAGVLGTYNKETKTLIVEEILHEFSS